MKKILLLSLISLALSACDSQEVAVKEIDPVDKMTLKEEKLYLGNGGGKASWKPEGEAKKALDELGI